MPKLLRLLDGRLIDLAAAPGLDIPESTDLMADPPDLRKVAVVRLEMPVFKNGRAFTQARLLRERYGFEGEIRIGGHVLPDQAMFLARVGASTVELDNETRLEDFRSALRAYSYAYQRPARTAPVYAQRGGLS